MIKAKNSKKVRSQEADQRNRSSKSKTIIRPFDSSDSEYADLTAIENANHPDSLISASEFRFYDEASPDKYLYERLVAERDERVVGYTTVRQPWWTLEEGKYYLYLAVDPDWHDTAVPGELYVAALKALTPHHPRQLITEIRENQTYLVELFERKGFMLTQRNPISALAVAEFDEEAFAAAGERARSAGIRIDSVAVIATEDKEWQRKVWDLEWEILQDVPVPEPLTRTPFEEWLALTFESPNFVAEGYFIARDGDQYIGMSSLWKSDADESKLGTGLTGVLPAYRRQGIATAMKVRGLCFARAYGAQTVETDNEENNPMLDLNRQLGFREKPAFVMYRKELAEANAMEKTTTSNP